jgi:hypothetical protein
VVVPVDDQIGAGPGQQGRQRLAIAQVVILSPLVPDGRVVEQHHPGPPDEIRGAEQRLQPSELGAADLPPGPEVAGGHAAVHPHQRHAVAQPDEGIGLVARAQLGRLVRSEAPLESPAADDLRDVGVVVAGNHGHRLGGRPVALDPAAGGVPLRRQRDVGQISGQRQVVDAAAAQVRQERLEQLHLVDAAPNDEDVEPPQRPLPQKIRRARAAEAAEVGVGHLGQPEHYPASIWISASRPKWSEANTPPGPG